MEGCAPRPHPVRWPIRRCVEFGAPCAAGSVSCLSAESGMGRVPPRAPQGLGRALGESGRSVSTLLHYYKSLRISTQLALWFLLIALGPFACVGYFTYKHSVNSLYTQVINNLVAISQRQVDEI